VGLNAALEKIARRAGVGIATLYRASPPGPTSSRPASSERWPTTPPQPEHALDNPDPWTGFCWLINKICAMQAATPG